MPVLINILLPIVALCKVVLNCVDGLHFFLENVLVSDSLLISRFSPYSLGSNTGSILLNISEGLEGGLKVFLVAKNHLFVFARILPSS